jgi:L-methionine (R)-S-oxide reductase
VACQTISFGKGVCGTAAQKFPGHIACDGESKSEIVVPILSCGKVVAIIDVDCAVEGGFDEVDKESLERLAKLLGASCDW